MGDKEEEMMHSIDHPLPVSKLRGVPSTVRLRLKSQRITTCAQLLKAAAPADRRSTLLGATGIDKAVMLTLVRRADMARIKGIGTVFGLMLEEVGIVDIEKLAAQDPVELHAALRRYNLEQRLARRSPTLEEVESWIAAARRLPIVLSIDQEGEAVA